MNRASNLFSFFLLPGFRPMFSLLFFHDLLVVNNKEPRLQLLQKQSFQWRIRTDRLFFLSQFLPTIFYKTTAVTTAMKGSQKWVSVRLQTSIRLQHLQKTAIKLSAQPLFRENPKLGSSRIRSRITGYVGEFKKTIHSPCRCFLSYEILLAMLFNI